MKNLVSFSFLFFFFPFFSVLDRVSLCSPGYPGTLSVDKASLRYRPASFTSDWFIFLSWETQIPLLSYIKLLVLEDCEKGWREMWFCLFEARFAGSLDLTLISTCLLLTKRKSKSSSQLPWSCSWEVETDAK